MADRWQRVKPRSVTRSIFASPIFWLLFGAFFVGVLLGGGDIPSWWVGTLAGVVCATLTDIVERWYIGPRRRQKVIISFCANCKTVSGRVAWLEGSREFGGQGCPEHGDACSAICRARARR